MPSKTFSMRMDAELRAALDAQAKLEERSASQIAERAIKEWLDRREAVRKELQTARKGLKNPFLNRMFFLTDMFQAKPREIEDPAERGKRPSIVPPLLFGNLQ
ncbi:MAG: ribbon-helix-helix domain-containing protein [Rhizobiaceae bacterium]|nr:ribbon-helix-helix domain-containing protein [Rhizobiaceae bacterium]